MQFYEFVYKTLIYIFSTNDRKTYVFTKPNIRKSSSYLKIIFNRPRRAVDYILLGYGMINNEGPKKKYC